METWQNNLKWQVLHFSCSTLEIRYLILIEVIIFITPIKEANTCHLPDFWEWFNFSFPSAVVVILLQAGANAITLKIGVYFIVPGDCTWSSLFWAEGEINPRCRSRNGGSSLRTQQGQIFSLGTVGGSCACCLSVLRMTCPAAARLLEVVGTHPASGCSALRHGDLLFP